MLRIRNKLMFLPLIFLLWCELAEAQQSTRAYRIGFLSSLSPEAIGYVEGKNIVIDYRYPEGREEKYGSLAAELVALKPAVIVTWGTDVTAAVKKTTTTVPVVFALADRPDI